MASMLLLVRIHVLFLLMGSCGGEEAEEGGFNSVQIVHGPYKVLPSRNTK